MPLVSRYAFALACLACISPCLAAPPQPPAGLPQPLRGEVEALLRASPVRGAAVVLVDADGPNTALWYGMADAERGVPMTPATCLRAGPVSETFASMLAMRLFDQGRLDLDEPLPDEWQPPAPASCAKRLTMAQLLEHTGGIDRSSRADGDTHRLDAGIVQAAATIAKRPLAHCPGLHYLDSGDGITLAAAALERAGGAPFDTLMQREVFAPLGITGTSFTAARPPGCLSRSYAADGRAEAPAGPWSARPAGALIATPLQLASAVQMFLRFGDHAAGRVLEACSMVHMTTGTTGLAGRQGAVAGAPGRGLSRFVAGGRLMIGQQGRIDGFQTTMAFAPEAGRGMVIMMNTADHATMAALRELVAAHLWRATPALPLPPVAQPAAGIAGWYANTGHDMPWPASWFAMQGVVRIEQDAAGLVLRSGGFGAPPRRVLAVSETAFRDETLPLASMAFARDADGRRWWLDGASHQEVAPWLVISKLAACALGLLAAAGLAARGLVVLGRRGMRRLRERTPADAAREGRGIGARPAPRCDAAAPLLGP